MIRQNKRIQKKSPTLKRKQANQQEMSIAEYKEYIKQPLAHPEHDEQVKLINWTKREDVLEVYPELELLYAVPNGGKRHIGTAVKMKAEGVKSGVPDLHLPVARVQYHSLWLEMKAPKGTVSTEQKWWLKRLMLEDHCVAVCYSAESAKDVLRHYLDGNHGLIEHGVVIGKIKKEIGL